MMHVDFPRMIVDLGPGDHLCCIYETEEEHRAVLTPFLRQGLERGEKVLYIVDARTAEIILGYLRDDGLDVEPHLARGQLAILTHDEAYTREGVFDPARMIALLQSETERALTEGYPALRATGEMTWALRGLPGSERLIEYEARLNEFLPGSKCLAICQYDRRRFDPAVLLDVLRTHPIAVIGAEIYEDFYYIPPAELLSGNLPTVELRHRLRRLAERKEAEEEIHRRNRELGVLNQIIAASATSAEPEAILEVACRELAQAFDVPLVAAALLNEGKTEAAIIAEYRAEGRPPVLHQAIPVADNPSFQYLLTRKAPLIVDDTQTDPRLAPIQELIRRRGTVSLLLLPLIIEGEVVGSLGLNAIEPRHFSTEEINLAWSVADQVAGALARARLARTHQRLITAVEQAGEGMIITDTEDTVLYVNPAFERVTGYSRAETVGQNGRMLIIDRQNPTVTEEIVGTIGAGQVWQGRVVNQKKDGTRYTVDVTIGPVRDERGATVNYVAIMRDVTREVQLEEQYRQAQKMEAVGRLTAGIAHDFNNLLTAINGFAELMQFQLPPDDPLQESLGKILHSGWRAADLVRQLLAFSRKQIIEPQVLDLNAVVGDMDKMLRRIIGEDIELKTALAPDLWPVKVDPAQIEQVIVNLAVNARDAMPGGGHLTVETANVVLDRDYAARHLRVRAGHYVLLAVSDDGLGMSKEVKAHLFEPFFTTKEAGKGTGLGLAAVYGIVEQSGGTIWVYSEAGHGTTFKIYLPRAEGAVAPLTRSDRAGELPRGMETVLLVEDDLAVRDLMARVLRQQGYAVLEAADGQEALRLARQHSGEIHLLLTDVVMPGLSGMALARQLAPLQPGMKLLFMSGYADNAVVQHSMLDAGVAFLQKPFSSLALARKVRQVLDAPQRESPKDRRQLEVPP